MSAQNAAFSPSGRDLLFTLFEGGYNLATAGLHLEPFPAGETTQLFREPGQAAVNLPGSAWSSVTGRRNRVLHGYFGVDLDVVWDVVSRDLPPLRERIRSLIAP